MKAKIYKDGTIEAEGDAGDIGDLIRELSRVRISVFPKIKPQPIKPTPTEAQNETTPPQKMPTNEDVANLISSKGGDFRHTLKEIEMHFLKRTYDGRIKSEKSPYDMIYNRVMKAREILQKTYGGEWKLRRIPVTHEREYWLDRGENKQTTTEDFQ